MKEWRIKEKIKNNWPSAVMTKNRPKDIQEADDIKYDSRYYKPFRK